MTETEELAYQQGVRDAKTRMLRVCINELGYGKTIEHKYASWILEREEAISHLRNLCRDFGDNDWSENLHLADIIEKHLSNHLYENAE